MPYKQGVAGSSPAPPTTRKTYVRRNPRHGEGFFFETKRGLGLQSEASFHHNDKLVGYQLTAYQNKPERADDECNPGYSVHIFR